MQTSKGFARIDHLDGLRGIAALLVVVTHFIQAFAPGVFSADTQIDHGYEKLVAGTPLNLLVHGHFWVAVFFVLSGYVLSLPGIRNPSSRWALSSMFKRYPRLAIPAVASTVFAWGLGVVTQSRHLTFITPVTFTQMPNPYVDPGTLAGAIAQGGFGAFFDGSSQINPVLWTIGIELFGSLLVIGLVWMLPEFKRRLIACLLIIALMAGQNWWPAFAMGIVAADLTTRYQVPERIRAGLAAALFVLAGWLGSYPYFGADQGIWRFLPVPPGSAFDFYSSTGAFLLVMAVCWSASAKRLLSSRPCTYLGDLSFSLYLVHFPLILCVSSFFVLHALRFFSYWDALLVAALPTMAVVWVCAEVFRRLFDLPAIRLSRRAGGIAVVAVSRLEQQGKAADA